MRVSAAGNMPLQGLVKPPAKPVVMILLPQNTKAKTGLEEAVVNQTTVWPESGGEP